MAIKTVQRYVYEYYCACGTEISPFVKALIAIDTPQIAKLKLQYYHHHTSAIQYRTDLLTIAAPNMRQLPNLNNTSLAPR